MAPVVSRSRRSIASRFVPRQARAACGAELPLTTRDTHGPVAVSSAAASTSWTADTGGTFRRHRQAADEQGPPSCRASSKPLSIGKYLSVPRRLRRLTSRKDTRPATLPMVPECALVRSPGDVCPHILEGVLNAVAKKWSVLIVGTLANHSRLRYTELQHRLGSISPKTLAARLRDLERTAFSLEPCTRRSRPAWSI